MGWILSIDFLSNDFYIYKKPPSNIRSDERIIGGGLLLIVSQELHEY